MKTQDKTLRRLRRRFRVRAQVSGTAQRPRLAMFRSNTKITAQLIDDDAQHTIASVSTAQQKGERLQDRTIAAAQELAKKAQEHNITRAVFDRGGYLYTGNIKTFADAAREAGLNF